MKASQEGFARGLRKPEKSGLPKAFLRSLLANGLLANGLLANGPPAEGRPAT